MVNNIVRYKMFVKKSLLLCLYLNFCSTIFCSEVEKNLKVEVVQVLFRHGARTPIACEMKALSPYNDESLYKPWGYAQLTNDGMREGYKVGQMLRKRYKDFLPNQYRREDVHAYSSAIVRVKESLQLLLAGLYPPTDNLTWSENLNWRPMPIHSNPLALDMLMKSRNCPQFTENWLALINSPENKKVIESNEAIKILEKVYGKDFKIDNVLCAYNGIIVQKNLNATLPKWYTDEIFKKIKEITIFYLDVLSQTPVLKKFNAGPMVKQVIENMNNKTFNRAKIYVYSTHEKNQYSFIKTHGMNVPKYPDYGTTLIVEKLRDEQDEAYVRILMWTGNPKTLITLKLENCTEICPMSEYLKIIDPVLPSEQDMRCLFENLQPTDIEKMLNVDAFYYD